MLVTNYVCDSCGISKKEANHWFLLLVLLGKDGPNSFAAFPLQQDLSFGPLAEMPAHVCGEDCAAKLFSRWLVTGRLRPRLGAVQPVWPIKGEL